jgi:hypothetical protein
MNTAIYIFGKFANNRYLQYPLDYTKRLFLKFKNLSNDDCQLIIHRNGDLVYYNYIYQFSAQCFIGICVIVNGIRFTDSDKLLIAFKNIIERTFKYRSKLLNFDIHSRERQWLIQGLRQELTTIKYKSLSPQKLNSDKNAIETITLETTMKRLPSMTMSSTAIISNIDNSYLPWYNIYLNGSKQQTQDDIWQRCLIIFFFALITASIAVVIALAALS